MTVVLVAPDEAVEVDAVLETLPEVAALLLVTAFEVPAPAPVKVPADSGDNKGDGDGRRNQFSSGARFKTPCDEGSCLAIRVQTYLTLGLE
jgi:hypothetical protein